MPKLYERYLYLKEFDSNKLYLFKSGNFYIFLDEDAKKINKITTLKLVNYSNNIVKCGFPVNSIDKYLNIFNNLGLNIQIIDDNKLINYLKEIKNIDLSSINLKQSINILITLQKLI